PADPRLRDVARCPAGAPPRIPPQALRVHRLLDESVERRRLRHRRREYRLLKRGTAPGDEHRIRFLWTREFRMLKCGSKLRVRREVSGAQFARKGALMSYRSWTGALAASLITGLALASTPQLTSVAFPEGQSVSLTFSRTDAAPAKAEIKGDVK